MAHNGKQPEFTKYLLA